MILLFIYINIRFKKKNYNELNITNVLEHRDIMQVQVVKNILCFFQFCYDVIYIV